MNKNDLQLLYLYNSWANARILSTAGNLSQEQFLATASFPHGGLRSTLTHVLFAEWLWRRRWEGESPTSWIKPEEFPEFRSLQTRWQIEAQKLLAFVEDVREEALHATFDYKTTAGEPKRDVLWQVMAHVVNHGTQHRSEAAALLTDFGHSPGDLDLIMYLRQMQAQKT